MAIALFLKNYSKLLRRANCDCIKLVEGSVFFKMRLFFGEIE